MNEVSLYPQCREWLSGFLRQKHPKSQITTLVDSHGRGLKHVLAEAELAHRFPESAAWDVKVDIVAVVQTKKHISLAFVEVKVKPIKLVDVGQLLGYCRVCHPLVAYLVSPTAISGDLVKLLRVYRRTDILAFDRTNVCVGKWDIAHSEPDWGTLIPSGELPLT